MSLKALALLGIALFISGLGFGWYGHHRWLQAERTERLEAEREAMRADIRKQVEHELREQFQQRQDAKVVAAARQPIAAVHWDNCPAVPAEFNRLLNAIGKAGPAPTEPAGEMSRAARTSRD